MSHKRIPVRFKVGDQVILIRGGVRFPLAAKIIALDLGSLVPHYMVDFGNGHVLRIPDFDLAAIDNSGSQVPVD